MSAHKCVSKVPEYASQFRKEWLYITGINRKIEKFLKTKREEDMLDYGSSYVTSIKKHIDNFLKFQEKGKLQKDLYKLLFKREDYEKIEMLMDEMDDSEIYFCFGKEGDYKFFELYDYLEKILYQLLDPPDKEEEKIKFEIEREVRKKLRSEINGKLDRRIKDEFRRRGIPFHSEDKYYWCGDLVSDSEDSD